MTTCAIMQPTYFPWIGYFDLIDAADIFVVLDTVQLSRQSWQTRNRIKGPGDSELMLSIPVRRTGIHSTAIFEAEVDDHLRWRDKHLRSLRQSYSKAAEAAAPLAEFERCLRQETPLLSQITSEIIRASARLLGITTSIVSIRDVGHFDTHRDELLVDVCRKLGAGQYLSARGSAAYIEEADAGGAFAGSGIALRYQSYSHPTYPQIGRKFVPFLGIVDLLCNVAAPDALTVIRSGRAEPLSSEQIRTLES